MREGVHFYCESAPIAAAAQSTSAAPIMNAATLKHALAETGKSVTDQRLAPVYICKAVRHKFRQDVAAKYEPTNNDRFNDWLTGGLDDYAYALFWFVDEVL